MQNPGSWGNAAAQLNHKRGNDKHIELELREITALYKLIVPCGLLETLKLICCIVHNISSANDVYVLLAHKSICHTPLTDIKICNTSLGMQLGLLNIVLYNANTMYNVLHSYQYTMQCICAICKHQSVASLAHKYHT
jgi:hypothetical protein